MATLKASPRGRTGTRAARRLREDGKVPAVIYGHGKDTVSVTLAEHEVELAVLHGERLLEIDLDGAIENVLTKDVQYDAFGNDILHVDLTRVDLNERVEVTVPVVLRGTPAGLADNGVLQQAVNEIRIECLVTAIPEDVRVSVNELNVGDALHVRDLPLPEGATLLDDPDALLCNVIVIAEEVEAPEEEEGQTAEPEVLGEKKEDETPGEGED